MAELRKFRDKLRNLSDKSKIQLDIKKYRVARNKYNTSVTNAKKVYFRDKFKSSSNNTKSLWDNINDLTGFRKKPRNKITKLILPDSNVIIDKTDEINSVLANQFIVQSDNKITETVLKDSIEKYESTYVCNDNDKISPITSDEIDKALTTTKKDSYSDFFVPLSMLKKCKVIVVLHLVTLFNYILSSCIVPQSFKATIVTPIYKGKGAKTNPSSFRPISCMNIYCKLFERVLCNRLKDRIEAKLCKQQHGFRSNRSCNSALIEFTSYLYNALDKPNGKVIVVYYDAKSAFDSLDRSLLISKLMTQYNLDPTYIKLLHNYLSDRVFKIKDDNNYYVSTSGIVQGGPICPLLYSAYQNDIVDMITTEFLLYCDDLCIYVEGNDLDEMMDRIKIEADKVQQWYAKNNMNINYVKTKYQIFHKPQTSIPEQYCNAPLKLNNGQSIEQVSCMKYLGIYVDSTLNFKSHYEYVLKRVSANLGYLYGIKRYLFDNVMIIMINSHIHSLIDYCVDLWAVQTQDQLNVIQKKIDTFLVNFTLPSFAKKMKYVKHKCKNIRAKLNVSELRLKFNLLTLWERRDLFLYKHAYRNLSTLKTVSADRRSWPLLDKPTFRLAFGQKFITFRAVTLWNAIPRNWDGKMCYSLFIQKCRDLLLEKRKDDFVYYY